MDQLGQFVILSGPSGVGKTLFIQKSLKTWSKFSNIVSFTTRLPRKGEKDGDFYYFVTQKKFNQLKENKEFLEWEKVHNDYYATSKKEIKKLWQQGKVIIKDIDVLGCRSIKKVYPQSISIFIYPPSINELKNRLLKRNPSITNRELQKRLARAGQEMANGRVYDFKIVNDSFKKAWREFCGVLNQNLKL